MGTELLPSQNQSILGTHGYSVESNMLLINCYVYSNVIGPMAMSRSMAYHAEVQHNIADMVIEMESIGPHLEKVAQDWSGGVDYGAEWPSKIVAAKYRAVEGSWRVVDTALDLAGGFGIFNRA